MNVSSDPLVCVSIADHNLRACKSITPRIVCLTTARICGVVVLQALSILQSPQDTSALLPYRHNGHLRPGLGTAHFSVVVQINVRQRIYMIIISPPSRNINDFSTAAAIPNMKIAIVRWRSAMRKCRSDRWLRANFNYLIVDFPAHWHRISHYRAEILACSPPVARRQSQIWNCCDSRVRVTFLRIRARQPEWCPQRRKLPRFWQSSLKRRPLHVQCARSAWPSCVNLAALECHRRLYVKMTRTHWRA